jgi:hypothetical protein
MHTKLKKKLKQKVPETRSIWKSRSIWKWSDDVNATLQDCFASTDWNMIWDSSNCIEEYTTSVTSFINKCIDVVPTVNVRTYSNQNPWITGNIRTKLKARAAAFKEWDTKTDAYKKSRYSLRPSNRQIVKTGLRLNPTTPGSDARPM